MRKTNKSTIDDLRKGRQASAPKQASSGLFSLFSSELESRQQDNSHYSKSIADLRDELDSIGKTLEQDPTIPNFKRFREVLSTLAKQVSTEAYRLEKIGGTPSNPRYYEIITVINKEADKLYELIVKDHKDSMAITASVIGIKGLVVDLTT